MAPRPRNNRFKQITSLIIYLISMNYIGAMALRMNPAVYCV